ncbi:short-chain dehydrogenase/reductase SDR [Saitoella complicata NRRL Y-17804]|uniref:Uncharacterized protein n=1 Tax=Saitoella complicata (strain BCRC 22490 / CBS 7301 / JCM 7358 / NBRC 10748 / NRRL Y-17804) TaxID=698492 RepID=A0A0E9N887_SAICN|nr:short-chain dehydrogenase/reductase SDR [Saitoella complicata NRRL Y-17804]ODQ55598.1 short-chain dehydrogenase/reductase SDR [Saitoella complicata NRRL Y-17804]GAO46013.1 hypothetical protein G7K_0258-t1 [Saitoella complicata NRRL Y-17804]
MSPLPACIRKGATAVITGGASGIGFAAARRFASEGMNVVLADLDTELLTSAGEALKKEGAKVKIVPTDVSKLSDVENLKKTAYDTFGAVHILMNNAGTGHGGPIINGDPDAWTKLIHTNLFGVVYGSQVFAPVMIAQGEPCAIINTGSKQGITCPPGNAAYNVSKAGVKVATEALAHELRNTENCKVSAHLLVPGYTYTGMTAGASGKGNQQPLENKPAAAWTADQVVDYLFQKMLDGKFYVICPDNDVSEDLDKARMAWSAADPVEGRPALSRWHPDYKDEFEGFIAERVGKK